MSETRGQQERTALSVASGCSDQYKDLIELLGTDEAPLSTTEHPRALPPGTRVCTYQVEAGGDRIGRLSSSGVLTPDQIDQINALLPGVRPGRGCSITAHSRFALMEGQGVTTLIALNGCALMQDSTVWTTTDQLRAQVDRPRDAPPARKAAECVARTVTHTASAARRSRLVAVFDAIDGRPGVEAGRGRGSASSS